jgi:hypothetical protein
MELQLQQEPVERAKRLRCCLTCELSRPITGRVGWSELLGGLFRGNLQPVANLQVNVTHSEKLQVVREPPRPDLHDLLPSRRRIALGKGNVRTSGAVDRFVRYWPGIQTRAKFLFRRNAIWLLETRIVAPPRRSTCSATASNKPLGFTALSCRVPDWWTARVIERAVHQNP